MIERRMVATCNWCTTQELLYCDSFKVCRNNLSDLGWYFYDGRDFCCKECLNNYIKERETNKEKRK